jgi:hypothetical protein
MYLFVFRLRVVVESFQPEEADQLLNRVAGFAVDQIDDAFRHIRHHQIEQVLSQMLRFLVQNVEFLSLDEIQSFLNSLFFRLFLFFAFLRSLFLLFFFESFLIRSELFLELRLHGFAQYFLVRLIHLDFIVLIKKLLSRFRE